MLALALAVALAPGPPPYGPRMMNAMVSQLPPLPMDSLGPPGATVLMLALVGGGLRLRRAVTDDDEPGRLVGRLADRLVGPAGVVRAGVGDVRLG